MINKSCFLLIFIIIFSCKNEIQDKSSQEITGFNLNVMLNRHSLKKEMFNDSILVINNLSWKNYFENKTKQKDIFYPSVDSTFTLVTNYKFKELKNYPIAFDFLEKKTNQRYIGFVFTDSLQESKFDFCWKDGRTFYFLEEKNGEFLLEKITMKNDSLWIYRRTDKDLHSNK